MNNKLEWDDIICPKCWANDEKISFLHDLNPEEPDDTDFECMRCNRRYTMLESGKLELIDP